MIKQKAFRYLVNKFTHNNYLEGVALDHFKNLKPSTIPMAQYHYNLSDKSDQYDSNTVTRLCVNLTLRVNPTKQESQQAKLERYFIECVS